MIFIRSPSPAGGRSSESTTEIPVGNRGTMLSQIGVGRDWECDFRCPKPGTIIILSGQVNPEHLGLGVASLRRVTPVLCAGSSCPNYDVPGCPRGCPGMSMPARTVGKAPTVEPPQDNDIGRLGL
jgi:hypothetical protein